MADNREFSEETIRVLEWRVRFCLDVYPASAPFDNLTTFRVYMIPEYYEPEYENQGRYRVYTYRRLPFQEETRERLRWVRALLTVDTQFWKEHAHQNRNFPNIGEDDADH